MIARHMFSQSTRPSIIGSISFPDLSVFYQLLEGLKLKTELTIKPITNHVVKHRFGEISIDDVDDVEDQPESGLSNGKEEALELCKVTFMQSERMKFIGGCTCFHCQDYEVIRRQPEIAQDGMFF